MKICIHLLINFVIVVAPLHADQTLIANRVAELPVIDGVGTDSAWSQASTITTQDSVADIPIELQAVHDGSRLYLKARFADSSENRVQKNLIWDEIRQIYRSGPRREDTFVIKWSMESGIIDLSLSAEQSYKADIWYWKAHRTDPVGKADDKYQLYSAKKLKKSARKISKSGKVFYLVRKGDAGKSAYKGRLVFDFGGNDINGIDTRQPEGSRADIDARGQWRAGYWVVEFSRKLDTRNGDDVVIGMNSRQQFGVSRYEIAGRKVDPEIEIPQYGSGETGENLFLVLQ